MFWWWAVWMRSEKDSSAASIVLSCLDVHENYVRFVGLSGCPFLLLSLLSLSLCLCLCPSSLSLRLSLALSRTRSNDPRGPKWSGFRSFQIKVESMIQSLLACLLLP